MKPSEPLPVADRYTKLAPVYDAWTSLTESKSLSLALARAAIRNGEAVLEVAVGTGLVFCEILRRNPAGRNVGIDLSEAMLRHTQRKASKLGIPFELLLGNARNIVFEDASFDVVVNNNMLGLVPEDEVPSFLREMQRVLRPGGRLVLVTMMRPTNALAAGLYRFGASWLGGWRDVRLEPIVGETGFEIAYCERISQLGIPSEVLIARKSGSVVSRL